MLKKYTAEFISTFFLVLFGCGAVVVNDMGIVNLGSFGVSLAFGLTVTVMIYLFGKTSGAHINPAVSFSFWLTGYLDTKDFISYAIAQTLGAIFAAYVLFLNFPNHETLGATTAQTGVQVVFLIEVMITFILMFVIYYVATCRTFHFLFP